MDYVPLGPLPPEINPVVPFQNVPNLPLVIDTLASDRLLVREAAAENISEEFAEAGLPHCIEDIEFSQDRASTTLGNSMSTNFTLSTHFRYNANIETFGEKFYYSMRQCIHGEECCNPDCIRDVYRKNVRRIVEIHKEKCRQRWLWPWCQLCRLWICIPCFSSCVNACIPIEPIPRNRDKHVCKCYFQRICKAHIARFRHFFPKYKFATCPKQFKCSRSNIPLKEWSGIVSEKRFVEQTRREEQMRGTFF